MPKYIVNRSSGWPIDDYARPHYDFGQEFESDDPKDAKAVEQGYLLDAITAEPPGPETVFALPEDSTTLASFTKEAKATLRK